VRPGQRAGRCLPSMRGSPRRISAKREREAREREERETTGYEPFERARERGGLGARQRERERKMWFLLSGPRVQQ